MLLRKQSGRVPEVGAILEGGSGLVVLADPPSRAIPDVIAHGKLTDSQVEYLLSMYHEVIEPDGTYHRLLGDRSDNHVQSSENRGT